MSEDCLFANVVTPPVGTPPAPVLVYIHAGEYHYGAGSDKESDWPYFAPDCVLVTFNYRIGVFGFLASEDLRDRSPNGGTGNYGALDQRAALQWVKRHIHAYGGDGSNVVLWGESSGGTSVAYHLAAQRSYGLYARAIMQSPGLTQVKSLAPAELNYRYILSALRSIRASEACVRAPGYTEFAFALSTGRVLGGGNVSDGWTKARAQQACDADERCTGITVSRPWHHDYDSDEYGTGGKRRAAMDDEDDVHGAGRRGWRARAATSRIPSLSTTTRRHGRPKGEVTWLLREAHNAHGDFARILDVRADAGGECPPPCATFLKATQDGDSGVACLENASAQALVNVSEFLPRDDTFETDGWAPVVDGVDLERSIVGSVLEGRIAPNVSVLLGSNLDEGTIFMYLTPPLACNATAREFSHWAGEFYGDALGSAVASAYQPSNLTRPTPRCLPKGGSAYTDGKYYSGAMRSAGDYAIGCRVRQASQALSRRGHAVHEFLFTTTPTWSPNYQNLSSLGAFHGAEVPYVFGDAFEFRTDDERNLSATMGCLWRNFAFSGDPNVAAPPLPAGDGSGGVRSCKPQAMPAWPRFGTHPKQQATLVLGTPEAGGVHVNVGLKREQCGAFHPSE